MAQGFSGLAPLGVAPASWGNVVARAALANALTQGIGVVTGLQKSFSWKSVAASGIGAGVGQAVGGTFNQAFGDFGGRFATGLVAGTATALARGGHVAVQQIATDAFGSAIGNSFVDSTSRPGTQEESLMRANQENFRASEIQQQNTMAQQAQTDALYGWSNGNDGLGFKVGSGEGLSYGGLRAGGFAPAPVDNPVVMRDFDPKGEWDPDALVPVGQNGAPIAELSPALRKQIDAMGQGWSRQGWSVLQGERPIAYDLANSTRNFLGGITGYDAAMTAQTAFKQGNYGVGAIEATKSLLEAGTSMFGLGGAGAASGLRMGGMTASELAAVRASYFGDTSSVAAGATYRDIVGRVPGQILFEADALSPGALGHDLTGLAGTFSGGRYATMQLDKPMTAYRAWAPGQSREFGAFWSLEEPAGSLQTRIDSALLPEWENIRGTPFSAQASQYTTIQLPAGTTIHIGEVGAQGVTWIGGKSQLLIDGGAQPAWKTGGGLLK